MDQEIKPSQADDSPPSFASAQTGDLAQLVSPSNKIFMLQLTPGAELHTHRGIVYHDELIGQSWGSQVYTHKGSSYFLLQPSLSDVLLNMRRNTQILYPKDVGYILVKMGIGPGAQVLEAGTGSGSLTTAMAWAVGPQGRVFTYESRQEHQKLAIKNLQRLGLSERVDFKLRDIAEGFDEVGVDALFLDVPNPYDYMEQVRRALKSGGYFGSLLPTTNQVSKLLTALYRAEFAFTEVCEILMRFYKPVDDRFRPADRMIAHTGYLIFARPMLINKDQPLPPGIQAEAESAEDEGEFEE